MVRQPKRSNPLSIAGLLAYFRRWLPAFKKLQWQFWDDAFRGFVRRKMADKRQEDGE